MEDAGLIEMAQIPARIMVSVCFDILSMPTVNWMGEDFDRFVLCVDRHSGWMVAYPSQKSDLTAKKAYQLIFEHGWDLFGFPAWSRQTKAAICRAMVANHVREVGNKGGVFSSTPPAE